MANSDEQPVEFFPSLGALPFVRHAFVRRIAGIDVETNRAEALRRLDSAHREIRHQLGLSEKIFVTAEQIHGNVVTPLDGSPSEDFCAPNADGLITDRRDISLGIYVADCCAVFLVDPARRAIGLVHSGKKGTALGVVPRAVDGMRKKFGSEPADLVAQLSPCVRPPDYEIDFAAEIIRQLRTAGVCLAHDCGRNTAADLSRYYSYRAEKGRTGRMLALLGLA